MSGRILTPTWTRLRALLLGALLLFTVAPAQAQTVDPVTNLNTASDDTKLTVWWINPTYADFARHDVIYSHYIRWKVQGTSTWLNINGANGKPQSYKLSGASEITGLTNGTTYEIGVRVRRWAMMGQTITYSNWVSTTGTPREIIRPILPTVSLSASPNPVTEGSSVTVTATLSRALTHDVDIPVRITDSTQPASHGTLTSITVSTGETSGTGTITTNQDADEMDETFTVALRTHSLPAPLAAGTGISVEITIRDDEGLQLSVETSRLTPACGETVTDTSVRPEYALVLTPAPVAVTETQSRVLGDANGQWQQALPVATSGRTNLGQGSGTFAVLRETFPGFRGFEFRLKDTPGVTAQCIWQFDGDGVSPTVPEPPPGGDGPPVVAPNRAQVQEAVKRALAAVARRAMASTLDNIGARFGDIGMSGLSLAGRRISLQNLAVEDHGSGFCTAVRSPTCAAVAWGRSMTTGELFAQSGFSVHLGGSENSLSDPSATLWSVWGRGDLGTFAGRGDARQRYDGELRTGWLGIDARAGSWVAGLAVSHGEGDADYNFAGDGLPGKGRLDTKLTAIYPYGRWELGDGLELYGVTGVGTGDARHKPQDGETESGDLSMHMASVGIRRAFPELAGMALAMGADASVTRIETDDGPDDIHRLSADSWRLRAGMEASRHFELERDAAFEPFLEAAFRQDGGDGLDGSGVELAGGLRYVAPRMFIEARGRWLATHSDEGAQEQSVSLTARAGPGVDGRGLFIALNPRWGAATGGAKTLWNEEMANPQGPVNKSTMDAQLGYGFVVPAQGVLTPFVEAGLAGDDHRRLRLGTRFEASREALRLELVGERSENETARPEHALRLDLRLWY